ncbi:MAG: hypothetical protein LBJ72_13375 [Dysgonamonadaceae bacterium]|nr:hypothetical protein [Dysgonamonadaceae bacterium]
MKKHLFLTVLVFISIPVFSQQVDLTNTKEMFSKDKLLKLDGGFSASTIAYTGNEQYARDPLTYYLSGNINLNILNLMNIPFSFNFTNSGSNYTYPTMPNRLSLHPTYKWVTGHFGDVSMNFSPYTLSGHLFTGAGIELNPTSFPVKISAMYGRLQKPVEYGEGNQNALASYKRIGAGVKIRYEKEKYQFGVTLFGAKDYKNSLQWKPDSLMIFPKENKAFSVDATIPLIENMRLNVEYGTSILNRDVRVEPDISEAIYHAIKLLLNYTFKSNTVGIGYERIDPGYETLGAYYFNNDLENITLNYARPFLNNKGNVSLTGGIQHDDLKNEKESQTRRFVASANVNYAHSERLNFNLSYSSFQTYMNIKSQFDYINELTPYDNLDTLDYTQLSQNINLGMDYIISRSESKAQNLNLNLSYQETADKRGDIVPEGNSSLFYNASLGYGVQFIPRQMNFNLIMNFTSNKMEGQDSYVIGPTFSSNMRFFDKKMTSGFGFSYNGNYVDGERRGEVWLLRFNAGYLFLKKHNFTLNVIYRNNRIENNIRNLHTNGLTVTAGYNYKF